jgi:hypothetical protein
MHSSWDSYSDLAISTHDLQRAARRVQQRASEPEAVTGLPTALSDLEEALEQLATGMLTAAQRVEGWTRESEGDEISPRARALRWQLSHLAARLRGAQSACPQARRRARELLGELSARLDRPEAERDRVPEVSVAVVPAAYSA